MNRPNLVFRTGKRGLVYYHPDKAKEGCIFLNDIMLNNNESPSNDDKHGLKFIDTVAARMALFNQRQIKGATKAHRLYGTLVYPSVAHLKSAVENNEIRNCTITLDDIKVAEKIWGPDLDALKGKTVRKKPPKVMEDLMKVPPLILKLYRDVFLTADIFFVNAIPFFISLSRKIDFTGTSHMRDRKLQTIFENFLSIYRFYLRRGFRIVTVLMDGEFAQLQVKINEMPKGPTVNLTSANEHVPEIERRIRMVKERVRALRHSLPFSRLPKILTIHLVLTAVKMMGYFRTKNCVSDRVSPRTIMTGQVLDAKRDLCLRVGQYVQTHEEDKPRNSNAARTLAAICMGRTSNVQGGFKFLKLSTGEKITRFDWTPLPMPDTVIDRVNALGAKQPELLTFTDRKGRIIGDNQIPGVDLDEQPAEEPAEEPEEPEPTPAQLIEDLDYHPPNSEPPEDATDDAPTGIITEEPPLLPVHEQPTEVEPPVVNDEPPLPTPATTTTDETAPANVPTEPTVETTGVRRSTRTRTQTKKAYEPSLSGQKYATVQAQIDEGILHPDAHMFFTDMVSEAPNAVEAIMTQLSLKAGLKRWKEKGYEAAYNEMKQLHYRTTFRPKHWHKLSAKEKASILESHLFLKEKRNGTIKGRQVAGGNKQRDFISKEDASSPTVSTEAVLLTSTIDAREERDVATFDIPNAFIQTKCEREEDMAIIKIRGVLVEMLVKIAPKVYKRFVTVNKKGEKELIVQCLNAIYGTMIASLLYYRKFCKTLTRNGFEMNPYDQCVFIRMVNGNQQTVCFHVDDGKISHIDPDVNTEFLEVLRKEYESIFEDGTGAMKITRGHVHEYLGMKLDFAVKGEVQVTSRSPTPARPRKVKGLAPKDTASRLISARLRVINIPTVFEPTPSAEARPQMMA